MTDNELIISKLLNPDKLWSREEILNKPSPIPPENGIYAWYFKTTPNIGIFEKYFSIEQDNKVLLLKDSHKFQNYQLLYIGISPKDNKSNNNIKNRLRGHMNGNSYGSTLRLSLGCLLADELNITLQKHGSSLHFGKGEDKLSQWISENTVVTFQLCNEPWSVEDEAINKLMLPLNLKDNSSSCFKEPLEKIRKHAKSTARLKTS
jgi:hypothetical protein